MLASVLFQGVSIVYLFSVEHNCLPALLDLPRPDLNSFSVRWERNFDPTLDKLFVLSLWHLHLVQQRCKTATVKTATKRRTDLNEKVLVILVEANPIECEIKLTSKGKSFASSGIVLGKTFYFRFWTRRGNNNNNKNIYIAPIQ